MLKVTHIAGYKGQVFGQSGRGDHEVHIADLLSEVPGQATAQDGEAFSYRVGDRAYLEAAEQCKEPPKIISSRSAIVDAFVHLGIGDNAECEARLGEIVQQTSGRFAPLQHVNNVSTVDQVLGIHA